MKKELVVLKIGTSSQTDQEGRLQPQSFDHLADEIVILRQDFDVAIVSSAAISAGAAELGVRRSDYEGDYDGLSMLSGIGQPLRFMELRRAAAGRFVLAQSLVTHEELRVGTQACDVYFRKLAHVLMQNVVPDINENDAVADDEIKVGDNDRISGMIALGLNRLWLWQRTHLVNLTNVDGYYDGDPDEPSSQVIARVENIADVECFAAGPKDILGTGGGSTKIETAKFVTSAGIDMYLANSRANHAARRAINGEIGTHFVARNKVE
jgi:glutamate 5-kinase